MKKLIKLFSLLGLLFCFTSCGSSENTITICASELPHAKILNEVVKDILKEKGYDLEVTVLDWTIQNDSVANNEYDANYFQHIPYLETYEGNNKLVAAAKVHYEKLCAYAKDVNHKVLQNGDKIVMVDDISNAERALNLLVEQGIVTIKDSSYVDGVFTNFDASNPLKSVEFTENYKDCTLTCIPEALLCQSLNDYDFGIIPGNTALTGLGTNFSERISFGESNNEELIDAKANIIAVKEENLNSPKTKALVEALSDSRVKTYIENTFGDSVLYHYVDLTK